MTALNFILDDDCVAVSTDTLSISAIDYELTSFLTKHFFYLK